MKMSYDVQATKDEVDHFASKTAKAETQDAEGDHVVAVARVEVATEASLQVTTVNEFLNDPKRVTTLDSIFRMVHARYRNRIAAGYTWRDLRQDTLVKLMENYPEERIENMVGLTIKIAVNELISAWRRQKAEKHGGDRVGSISGLENIIPSDRPLENNPEGKDLLRKCRKILSGKDLLIFDKHILEDKNLSEIGVLVGDSRQAVAARWFRIIQKLRRVVKDR